MVSTDMPDATSELREAVELRWAMVQAHPGDQQGEPRLLRAVAQPPRERLVPHFGCVPKV